MIKVTGKKSGLFLNFRIIFESLPAEFNRVLQPEKGFAAL